MGEVFVSERQWDWSIFEPARNEMSDAERDVFLDQDAISVAEIILFHRQLKEVEHISEMQEQVPPAGAPPATPPADGQSTAPSTAKATDDPPAETPGRPRSRAKEQPPREQTNKTSKNNKDADTQPPAGDLPSATA